MLNPLSPLNPPTPVLRKNKKERIKKYGKRYLFDWLALIILAAIALGIYWSPPLSKRLFAVSYDGTPISYEYGYPVLKEIIPTFMAAVIAGASGVAVLSIAQIWLRSGKEFHRALMCLMTCLISAAWFQVICKIMIGGFRPNFLDICKPDMSKITAGGKGYYGVYFDHSICTGDIALVNDALESFPSGHSTAAFAGNMFIALYLNAKLKLWGFEYAPVWKLVLVFLPVLAACLLSLCRLVDYTHHWYDIVAGAIIGTLFAFASFRMHYRSIFDPDTNHLLLPHVRKYKEIPQGTTGSYQFPAGGSQV